MQFDLEALLQLASPKIAAATAATVVAVAGAIYLWPGEDQPPAETVTVNGPIFRPVALTPPAPYPASKPNRPGEASIAAPADDVSLVRAVQRLLKSAGCYDGAINGNWNGATRRGMAEFTSRVNARLPLDRPAPELLALLEMHDGTVCGAPVPAAPAPKEEVASVDKEPAPQAEPEQRAAPAALPFVDQSGARHTASAEIPETTGPVPPAVTAPRSATAEPRRTHRRYKGNSLSRQVSKGFKSLQRTFKAILW